MVNVGRIDRVFRIVVGAALLALTFMGPYREALFPWGLVGIVPVFTALIGWCPIYRMFGMRTCSTC